MKQTVTLEIGGASYRLNADAEEKHLQRLAAIINERVEALGPAASRATPAQRLVAVALGLADDLLQAERQQQALQQTTRSIVQGAIQRIDERLSQHDGASVSE